jgi:hypothetical protein
MIHKSLTLAILILPQVWGQARPSKVACPESGVSFCEVSLISLPATDSLSVNTVNSNVSVETWGGAGILVRAEVRATAASKALAQEIADQVVVDASAGEVSVKGPSSNSGQSWSVKLEIDVPAATGLTISTVNGGIAVHGVEGAITFDIVNGDASLDGVGGNVTGNAVNGSILIAAGGDHWAGQTLAADTVNGDIEIDVPADCTAHVTASVADGTFSTNFPVEIPAGSQRVSFDLGTAGSSAITMSATKGNIQLRSE